MKELALTLACLGALLAAPRTGNAQSLKTLNKPIIEDLDQVSPFHEGLAAIRKDNQWGFIDTDGNLVIEFRDDLVWNENADPANHDLTSIPYPQFREGRCMVRALRDEDIPVYGFINREGDTVIPPQYLNLTPFQDGRAVGILVTKTFRGKNNFQLNIYDYSFTEAVLNLEGEIMWPISERDNILMQKRRYERPSLSARLMGNGLLAVETTPGKWEIRRMQLEPSGS
jgi:hypothetical protein